MKYILVDWPEIQFYMGHPNYRREVYYDSEKGVWFVPETWEDIVPISKEEFIAQGYDEEDYCAESCFENEFDGDIGNLDDALG